MKKYKVTGCARFFFALIIIAPIAYLGASYYNGQDGIQNIKNLLGIGKEDTQEVRDADTYKNADTDLGQRLKDTEEALRKAESEITSLKKENQTLRNEIEALKSQGGQQ